jgi:hypothetical protein
MNHQGQWLWKLLVIIVLGGFTLGFCIGQDHSVWLHNEGRVRSAAVFSLHDDKNHVLCYGVEGDNDSYGGPGVALSCVKLEAPK